MLELALLRKPKLRRFWAAVVVLTVVGLLLLELGSYFAIQFLSSKNALSVLFYRTPDISAKEYDEYMADRDPVLGWPSRSLIGGGMYDDQGARPSPAFPPSDPACVSLYGDSFTYSNDVSDADAWGNLLAERLHCRVANFGVGGYGMDQALLRFRNNAQDAAPITILGILPHDLQRNLAQNVYFIFGSYPLGFKPRFVVEDGRLILISLPTIPADALDDYSAHPQAYLPYESFLPNTRLGPSRVGFPYTLSLARAALHPPVMNWLRGRPGWMTFVEPDDPSGGLDVATAILSGFAEECDRRKKRCAVVLFPTPSEVDYYQKRNRLAMQSLIDAADSIRLPHLNLVVDVAARLNGRGFCKFLNSPETCSGHFNKSGNELIADIVDGFLQSESSSFQRALDNFRP